MDPPVKVAWLEKFYDIVFVAVVGRFANELGTAPTAANTLQVLGWLAGLWMTWFLVNLRLNRFPDERPATRLIVVVQLVALCVAAAAAISTTTADNARTGTGSAVLAVTTALLYLGVLRSPHASRRLVAVPVTLSLLVAAGEVVALSVDAAWARALPLLASIAVFVVVLGWYLPRLARSRPVDARKAADRHAGLFLVLMGLSFLKVAFVPDATGQVAYVTVIGAFLTGFSLWSMYVDGVLPLGFPTSPRRQQVWLSAQLLLALSVTVAAAAAVALPKESAQAPVSPVQALLQGGSLGMVVLSLAVVAVSADSPSVRRGLLRVLSATVLGILTCAALLTTAISVEHFSLLAGAIVVLTAAVEAVSGRLDTSRATASPTS